ncbi:hypothetical protein BD779DRAFT_1597709 [Infundibulicybe gibba]|nr:hypothetical protein BD779DRAFT_1597709 [Infundibulicybe gibba]
MVALGLGSQLLLPVLSRCCRMCISWGHSMCSSMGMPSWLIPLLSGVPLCMIWSRLHLHPAMGSFMVILGRGF